MGSANGAIVRLSNFQDVQDDSALEDARADEEETQILLYASRIRGKNPTETPPNPLDFTRKTKVAKERN